MRAGISWLLLFLIGQLPAANAWAQNATPVAAAEPSSAERTITAEAPRPDPVDGSAKSAQRPAIEASQLDTFMLRDSKGNLVPVLGMPFEEFEQLLRLKKGLGGPVAPRYTLDALSIVGTVEQRVAHLQVTATIRVRDEGVVRVPLRMPTAALRQPPKHEGKGDHFITFEAAEGGYVSWIKGSDGHPHVVTLQMSVALEGVGNETRLALALPRATEASLRLTTAQPNVEASLQGGEGIVTASQAGIDRSEISVLGPAGDMQLTWRSGRAAINKGPMQLDASGDIRVRVESEHRITSDAWLQIRSYGSPLEALQVRLPPGMELVPITPTGYTLNLLPVETAEATANETPPRQLVEVRLDKPAASASIRVLATLPAEGPSSDIRPAMFEVLGAVRQRGTIDFLVEGEWQLDWTEDASVRRVEPSTTSTSARPVARFDYFRQPCGLQVRVAPRPSRISVEPTYRIDIDAQHVRLEGTLKYRFRGARTAGLAFEMGDWKFGRLAPNDLFDIPVQSEADGRLQAPFRVDATPPTELELKFEAHRLLPPNSERIAFSLPRPVADVIAPATIAIAAADHVDLNPLLGELRGLSADPAVLRIPGRQQPALMFRDVGGAEPAVFAAALRVRGRATTASARATVRLERQRMQVEQRLEYRIVHEPQRSFTIVAPRTLMAGGLQASCNGEALEVTPLAELAGSSPPLARLQFMTPTDQIGVFSVILRYTLPAPTWDEQEPLHLTIPLVVPSEGGNFQFTGQTIDFDLDDALQVEPDVDDAEESARPTVAGTGASRAFTWPKAVHLSHWIVHRSHAPQTSPIAITKGWIQTWLSPRRRYERVCFRFSTAQSAVQVRLPEGVTPADVHGAINGQEVSVLPDENDLVQVAMPPAARGSSCVLELYYSLEPPKRRLLLRDQLIPAQLEGGSPARRMYWQLVLPEDEYLVVPPTDLTAEMAWPTPAAAGWPVGRRPLLDQRKLEEWIGASQQDLLPRGTNEYLFGTLGDARKLDLLVVNRRLLVSLGSATVLGMGLLLLYVPRLRRPSVVLAGAVALAAMALVRPDLALLAGQWSILGVLVAVAAAAWTWIQSGRIPGRIASLPTAEAFSETKSHSAHAPKSRHKQSAGVTTTTAPAGAAAAEVQP